MKSWIKEYSVGVKELDDQHIKMLEYINEVEAALYAEDSRQTIVRVLNGLVRYTKDHFATEETYFKLYDYENTEAHISEHLDLISSVEKLVYELEIGGDLNPDKMLSFLEAWLFDHIMSADREYMSCFESNGHS